jgi:hypothetical protein
MQPLLGTKRTFDNRTQSGKMTRFGGSFLYQQAFEPENIIFGDNPKQRQQAQEECEVCADLHGDVLEE